jgi:hypothetical protein
MQRGSFKSLPHERSQASGRPEIFLSVLEASANALKYLEVRPPRARGKNMPETPYLQVYGGLEIKDAGGNVRSEQPGIGVVR